MKLYKKKNRVIFEHNNIKFIDKNFKRVVLFMALSGVISKKERTMKHV